MYARQRVLQRHFLCSVIFYQSCADIPRGGNLLASGIVTVLELVKHQGMQLFRIYLAVFREYGLLCFYIHNFTNDSGYMLRIQKFQKLTFHDDRKFFDDRSVYPVTFTA